MVLMVLMGFARNVRLAPKLVNLLLNSVWHKWHTLAGINSFQSQGLRMRQERPRSESLNGLN
jgi:hypothetical protein